MNKNHTIIAAVLVLIAASILTTLILLPPQTKTGSYSDTWNPQTSSEESAQYATPQSGSPGAVQLSRSSGESLGFAAGGAKDIDNFRENIENDYLPLYTDVTYEGLFYDYYFDTGKKEDCSELFCPSYSYAVSRDPFSQKDQYYLSVGLNSGIKQSDFERKKLNLVIVLDVSGSMSSQFDSYYYDQFGNRHEIKENGTGTRPRSSWQQNLLCQCLAT